MRDWALELIGWVAAACLFVAVQTGPSDAGPSPESPHPIPAAPLTDRLESYEVYDGDTLTACTIDLGYGIILRDSVRIVGVDAPELSGNHRNAGLVVRAAAAVWLAGHDSLWLIGRGRDKYGRILGDIQPPGVGQSLSEWLIERGYAHPYDGTGKRPEWTKAELERIADGQ